MKSRRTIYSALLTICILCSLAQVSLEPPPSAAALLYPNGEGGWSSNSPVNTEHYQALLGSTSGPTYEIGSIMVNQIEVGWMHFYDAAPLLAIIEAPEFIFIVEDENIPGIPEVQSLGWTATLLLDEWTDSSDNYHMSYCYGHSTEIIAGWHADDNGRLLTWLNTEELAVYMLIRDDLYHEVLLARCSFNTFINYVG